MANMKDSEATMERVQKQLAELKGVAGAMQNYESNTLLFLFGLRRPGKPRGPQTKETKRSRGTWEARVV